MRLLIRRRGCLIIKLVWMLVSRILSETSIAISTIINSKMINNTFYHCLIVVVVVNLPSSNLFIFILFYF